MRGDRSAFAWPGGARTAVLFNVMFEGWSEGKAPGMPSTEAPASQP